MFIISQIIGVLNVQRCKYHHQILNFKTDKSMYKPYKSTNNSFGISLNLNLVFILFSLKYPINW